MKKPSKRAKRKFIYSSEREVFIEKTTVICHKSAQTCKKTPQNGGEMKRFNTKIAHFCVNECKSQNICHTILMLNPFI